MKPIEYVLNINKNNNNNSYLLSFHYYKTMFPILVARDAWLSLFDRPTVPFVNLWNTAWLIGRHQALAHALSSFLFRQEVCLLNKVGVSNNRNCYLVAERDIGVLVLFAVCSTLKQLRLFVIGVYLRSLQSRTCFKSFCFYKF